MPGALYKFHMVPISKIIVTDRQRKSFDEEQLASLSDSIFRHGLINPITVNKQGLLVAGERRLRACQKLGWSEIPAHFIEELDKFHVKVLELEENIQRQDLTWQEDCAAVLDYHNLRHTEDPAWGMQETADALNQSIRNVRRKIQVSRAIALGDAPIIASNTFSAACGVLDRRAQRAIDTEIQNAGDALGRLEDIPDNTDAADDTPQTDQDLGTSPGSPSGAFRAASLDIHVDSFLDFAKTYSGTPFNCIHCDFPYGINMHKAKQGEIHAHGAYDDSSEIFDTLLDTLLTYHKVLISGSAHILFWYAAKNYTKVVKAFTDANFDVNPVPLIWYKTDNVGMLPDHKRGPRQVYETALLISRGDRHILRPVSNVAAVAAQKQKAKHLSEKPFLVLTQFLSMLVDSSTKFLDPTCGSGSALAAAEWHGAGSITGLDINPDHVDTARAELQRIRMRRGGQESDPEADQNATPDLEG